MGMVRSGPLYLHHFVAIQYTGLFDVLVDRTCLRRRVYRLGVQPPGSRNL